MPVSGETYAQRAVTDPPVTTVTGAELMRVNEDLITLTNMMTTLAAALGIQIGNTRQAASDAVPAQVVRTFDTTPGAPVFRAELSDASVLAEIGTSFNAVAAGLVSALNCLPNRVWVTTNQTEPAWSNGDFWIRPRV